MRRLVTLRSEMLLTADEETTVIRYEDGQILERVVDTCSRLLDRLRYRHVAERCRCAFVVWSTVWQDCVAGRDCRMDAMS